MKNYLFVAIPLAILIISQSCKTESNSPILPGHISIDGQRFVDDHKRQVILSGLNIVNKNPSEGYIANVGQETFTNIKNWGFNVIRLGIIWDGLEPEPGVYNEEYLSKIENQIRMAEEAGLFVFLDMHQDLFSVKYSDGAPEWATLDEGLPNTTGEIWSDAYLISDAVQTAFDNFWSNKPAPDGVGVQDHYKAAWNHVAARFLDNPTVIGYDLMNEPFPGSSAKLYLPTMFSAFGELIGSETGNHMSMEEVGAMWNNQDTRYQALSLVEDKERFSKVVDAVYDMNSEFESGVLQEFYQGVSESIRAVDSKKILFLEHSYFCNSGVSTAISPVKGSDGDNDPYVAYAAHGYDLLVDTKNLGNSSSGRLDLIFSRIKESGERMGVPVLIGEWGALGRDNPALSNLARTNLSFFEEFGFSNTYWAYHPGTENREYFKEELIRAFPEYISGKLIAYSNDKESSTFNFSWRENPDIDAPTQIYIPDLLDIDNIKLTPESEQIMLIETSGSRGGYLVIPNKGKEQVRKIIISFTNSPDIELNQGAE